MNEQRSLNGPGVSELGLQNEPGGRVGRSGLREKRKRTVGGRREARGAPPAPRFLPFLVPTCLPQVQVSSLVLPWPLNEDQSGVCCPAGWQPGRLFHNLGQVLWTEARECHRGHCTGYSFPRCPKSPDSVHGITHARPHSKWADGGPWSHLHHVVWKPYPGTLLLSLFPSSNLQLLPHLSLLTPAIAWAMGAYHKAHRTEVGEDKCRPSTVGLQPRPHRHGAM